MQNSAWLWIGVGGFFGAVARYGVSTWFTARWGLVFPYGTLFVNLSGSFALCLIIAVLGRGLDVAPYLRLALTVGFLGSYTTFSTLSADALLLFENGQVARGLGYVLASVAGGGLMGILGLLLGRSV